VGRVVGMLLVVLALVRSAGESYAATESISLRSDRLDALMGTAVLAGNFFLTIGFLYKVIFAVWVLPQCLRLSDSEEPWSKHPVGFCERWLLWSGWKGLGAWVRFNGCLGPVRKQRPPCGSRYRPSPDYWLGEPCSLSS
jgi:hypothetical protein